MEDSIRRDDRIAQERTLQDQEQLRNEGEGGSLDADAPSPEGQFHWDGSIGASIPPMLACATRVPWSELSGHHDCPLTGRAGSRRSGEGRE